ncbi:MAG: MFS transporter [Porphyromonadaceae bacterium]|nr:MFS transporter [Porphyromonadaceae bacterium]
MTQQKQTQSYLVPFIIMVVLMALVGLITNLNGQFQAPMQAAFLQKSGSLTNALTTLITFAFFLGYLAMGIPSAKCIEKKGYKNTLITGLFGLIAAFGLYELSAYVFESVDLVKFQTATDDPNVVIIPVAYYIFLLAGFVAGSAMTFLQAVLNPYIVACDVKGTTGVTRQSIAGTANSTMATIAPILVASVIFAGKSGLDIALSSLYIPFLVLIVLVGGLIAALSKLHLPAIASTEKKEGEILEKSVWSFSHLALGVVAIFMYVGVEVCIGNNINLHGQSLGFEPSEAALMATIYWGLMLVGRLCGSFLSGISASKQLLITSLGAGILVLGGMILNNPYLLVGAGLFHSVMWGAIFSLAIDKLGKYTSAGSGALMMGIVGGAILPFAQGILADSLGGWQFTWIIVLIGEAYLLYYALVGHKVRQLP